MWLCFSLYVINLMLPIIERHWITYNVKPIPVAVRGELGDSEKSTIAIFEQTSPSVVYISTSDLIKNFWTRDVRKVPRGTGSGFIWDKFGHVVTNYHVIEGAAEANIRLNDGRTYPAKLVGVSPNHDLAVLKIDVVINLPAPLPIGSSNDLKVGQSVFAIGNPFGFDYTLTSGLVSALNRTLSADTRIIINNLIQTDAAVNPGNSGGPLLDSAGRLIGINTAIYSPSGAYVGIGFAVPVDTINRVIPELIEKGHYTRPSLGIVIDQDINEQVLKQLGIKGVVILDVERGSSAANNGVIAAKVTRYGITLGDVIQSIDGIEVNSVNGLLSELDNYQRGQRVEIVMLRDNQLKTVLLTLA